MWLAAFFDGLDGYVPREWLRGHIDPELSGVLLPYALRFGIVQLVQRGLNKLCGGNFVDAVFTGRGDGGAAEVELVPTGRSSNSRARLLDQPDLAYREWELVRIRLGFKTQRLAIAVCVVRVLFWHWLQPVLYFLVFYAASDLLDTSELYLGLAVALRELIYFSAVFLCIFLKPGFFLYSPSENSLRYNMVYAFMPEKLALAFLAKDEFTEVISIVLFLVHGHWYWPLMIGYLVTAASPAAYLQDIALYFCRDCM